MKLLLTIGIIIAASIAVVQVATGESIQEDFETYAVGGYPGGDWVMKYNAISDPANNLIVDSLPDNAFMYGKALQLYGNHGPSASWAAAAYIPIPSWNDPFYVSALIRPGDESSPGGHYVEAKMGLARGFDLIWPGVYYSGSVRFVGDDSLTGPEDPSSLFASGIHYYPNAWHHVHIGVVPSERRLYYRFNGMYMGSSDVPDEKWPDDGFYLAFESGDGIAWIDKVIMAKPPDLRPYIEALAIASADIIATISPFVGGPPLPDSTTMLLGVESMQFFADLGMPIPAELQWQFGLLENERMFAAYCDVELRVTDPLGRYVDSEGGNIPGARYYREDFNGDGEKEVIVLLEENEFPLGEYSVEVTNLDLDNAEEFSLGYYDPELEVLVPLAAGDMLDPGSSIGFLFTTPLAGDANGDSTVDLQDFSILKANFGQPGDLAEGNFNGDSVIDLQDFGILKANFGNHLPEPVTLALLLLGGMALLRRRWPLRRTDLP